MNTSPLPPEEYHPLARVGDYMEILTDEAWAARSAALQACRNPLTGKIGQEDFPECQRAAIRDVLLFNLVPERDGIYREMYGEIKKRLIIKDNAKRASRKQAKLKAASVAAATVRKPRVNRLKVMRQKNLELEARMREEIRAAGGGVQDTFPLVASANPRPTRESKRDKRYGVCRPERRPESVNMIFDEFLREVDY